MRECLVCRCGTDWGKPQCNDCYKFSNHFIETDICGKIHTDEEYFNFYNSLIAKAKIEKSKIKICNQIIACGLFAYDYETDLTTPIAKLYQSYHDVCCIIDNNLNELSAHANIIDTEENLDEETKDFRKKYPRNRYCEDGHYVRSEAERTIDNYLYTKKILHCYEHKFRLTEDETKICKKAGKNYTCFYPDFYIPNLNLYIEYFGGNDNDHNQKTELKIQIMQKRKDINFAYLTAADNDILTERLADILHHFQNN